MPLVQVLAGIAPPDIRRNLASDAKKTEQGNAIRHLPRGYQTAPSRLKLIKNFLKSISKLIAFLGHKRLQRLISSSQTNDFKIRPMENPPPGYRNEWNT